jgi:uncharacterized protein (TIGR03437 family)
MAYHRPLLAFILSGFFSFCDAQLQPLTFHPVVSLGSKPLDRVVMISASPDLLHIYDPVTANDATIVLPKTPLSLSVTPDGLHATVGHDGLVTWVDLVSSSILKTLTVPGQVNNVIAGDTYAWIFIAGNGYTGGMTGLNLSTGAVLAGPGLSFYYATAGVLDATQTALYLSQDGSSPNDMEKVSIASGQIANGSNWPYHGDYPDCGPYYLSADGSRIFTSCETVVHASSDKKVDMNYLRTLPVNSFPIAGLAEAASLKKLAVIASTYQYGPPQSISADTQVQLFDTGYLTSAGNVSLLPFVIPSGSFPAHGKAVFFSKDETRLFVVVQADATSNLSNNFGVEVINIGTPPVCAVQLAASSLTADAAGSLGSVALKATPDCFYSAKSNVDWINLAGSSFGSGNGTVQWIVRPNYTAQSRTGAITINGQDYTIQQNAAPASPQQPARLSFNVVDAAYSGAMDRIVAVSTSPDELHIYDPVAQADKTIPLVMPPFAVSVAPDGLHAAVGHDGWISYIDLQGAAVLKSFPIVTDVHHVLLAGNGYIYAFPARDWSDIYSLEIATGNVTNTGAIYEGRIPRLEPNGKYFYLSGDGWFSKWDITKGAAVSIKDNPGQGLGGNYWMYQDGSQLISDGAKLYATSDVPAQDAKYTGTYPNISSIIWAANSSTLHSTALIPNSNSSFNNSSPPLDTQVQFYGDAYLGFAGTLPLPQFPAGGKNYPGHGLFAFWNSPATALYVIERADTTAMLPSTDAVYTINPSMPPAGCTAAPAGPLATLPAGGGFGSTVITAGAGCPWSAASDSSWLTINSGAIGAGPASISWSAAANTGGTRSANITIGGQSYPVTQLGAGVAALTLSQTAFMFSADWSSTSPVAAQTFSVKSGSGPFTVAATSPWITVTAASSTMFSVSVNPGSLAAGTNLGSVNVTAADGQIQSVTVTLTIAPKVVISPSPVTLQYGPGDPLPSATISVANGTSSTSAFSVSGQGLANATPSSGFLPASIQVSPSSIAGVGSYSTNLTIYIGNQYYQVPVKITVLGAPVSVTAITSASDFSRGAVAPGEIVVLWGSGLGPATLAAYTPSQTGAVPTKLFGTTVTFNNYVAPLLYTSAGAVGAIVPYEVAGQSSANVVVSYNGSVSAVFTQSLAPTAPHFFSTTNAPAGQLLAVNSDYSPNSKANPAPAGSVVVLYATGEGVTSPPGIDGTTVGSRLTQPLANVTATIGGQPADVLYAGGSPGLIEGLLQINLRIPAGTPPGNPLVSLQIGAAAIPPGGTIAVK